MNQYQHKAYDDAITTLIRDTLALQKKLEKDMTWMASRDASTMTMDAAIEQSKIAKTLDLQAKIVRSTKNTIPPYHYHYE